MTNAERLMATEGLQPATAPSFSGLDLYCIENPCESDHGRPWSQAASLLSIASSQAAISEVIPEESEDVTAARLKTPRRPKPAGCLSDKATILRTA